MKLHPFFECVVQAKQMIEQGHTVHQQFNCSTCGTKQTMETPDVFFKSGRCQECGAITDIETDGCNYMLHAVVGKRRGIAT